MRVEIRTSDTGWAARRRAAPGRDGRVAVEVDAVEHLTFAGRPMVRFDLGTDLPCDWPNRWGMAPEGWLL